MTKLMVSTDKDAGMARAIWSVVLIGATATVIAAVVGGAPPAVSVAVGALIAAFNLWAIMFVVRGMLDDKRPSAPWALFAVLKFSILIGGVYLLLKSGWVDLVPLLIGYGALPLGIVAGQLGALRPVGEET